MQVLALAAAERRRTAGEAFFGGQAERISHLCHLMAERFARGGRLLAFGEGPVARSDARHVAVEFVHPVIVGKRALPALALTPEGGPLPAQLKLLAEPEDIALAFGEHPEMLAAVNTARLRGCLTMSGSHVGAEWELVPEDDDPFVAQELVETLYHVLWELVHVFFEHQGLLKGRIQRTVHDAGASSFLYPFLGQREDGLESVLADVRASVLAKAAEASDLRTQTLCEGEDELRSTARAMRSRLEAGGRVLALGNGGSATDAMDAVADLRLPPARWPARAALDLTEDPAIITAIANDVGEDAIFSRQIIAQGREDDTLLAFSTSGGSRNVLAALAEARQRRLLTVALVGYDGGRIAAEGLADHVIITRSEHIPRIQEAQASAWHVLRELLETPL
ncbi:MAG: Phosphoheptose isomerase-like protein [Solirubrobacterales bacterium]|jgi:D-sedoheptulose 7-phosphate isomerase|nr:Phosphoheptose isomerase-like protein [Solirubrobacterales bacterium]